MVEAMRHHLRGRVVNDGRRIDLGKRERLEEEKRVGGGYERTEESNVD